MKSTWKRIFWGLVLARLALSVYHLMKPYDPIDVQLLQEANLEATHLISKYGYVAENHTLVTADGYIITLHRIPYGKHQKAKPGIPILLLHGVTAMSTEFVIVEDDSLGFQLADKGYDVWLGNLRGNKYTKHKNLTKSDYQFWEFGVDECADYDVPAMMDYILLKTKYKKLFLLGYSLGGAVGLSALSWNPKLNGKIAGFIAVAPTFKGQYRTSPVFNPWLIKIFQVIAKLTGLFGYHQIRNFPVWAELLVPLLCPHHSPSLCIILPSAFGGYNPYFMNLTRISIMALHHNEGISSKTFSVILQAVLRESGARYDYGSEKNQEIYKSDISPLYPLEKISTPTIVYYAANDAIADPIDVYLISQKLKNLIKLKLIGPHITSHNDFLMSKVIINELLNDITEELKKLWK